MVEAMFGCMTGVVSIGEVGEVKSRRFPLVGLVVEVFIGSG